MDIRANREILLPILAKVGGVVERRQTLPVLGNFLISAADDSVQITGTDLEVEIRSRFAASIQVPGEVTVPARKFMDICRALPEGADVVLRTDKDRVLIVTGRSRFTLSTLPATDFPIMEGGAGEQRIEIDQRRLKRLLDRTGFAMAHQDVRYYLNGVLIEIHGDRLVAVATDGHRLAKAEDELVTDVPEVLQIILPRKTVLELGRLLGVATETPVRLDISDKLFRALVDETVLTSKLVDGRYPDYERVIPRATERTAVIDRDQFRQALQRTSILSNEKYKGVRLHFEENLLRLQAHNPEQEEAQEEVEIEYSGDPVAIGFNVGYLVDVLNAVGSDRVQLNFTDAGSSAVMMGLGSEDEIFVVMPMRL